MKKIMYAFLVLAIFAGLFTHEANGQNVSVNSGAGSYATLKDAFDAINLGTYTGAITIDIIGNTTETAPAVLNASGVVPASYTSIIISPSGGLPRTISGALTAIPLIDLNGADNVTINGLNDGTNSLTITNSGLGSSSAIRFTADATSNLVTNCTLLGSTGASFGVVYFGVGTTTGNDNNTISYCNIGPAGANLPLNGIYSMNTSSTNDNSGITISNNNIYDYYNASSSSSAMNINSGNSGWTISNNRLYQTANRTYTSAGSHYGIFITSGVSYTISGNIIGFANSAGTGTTNMIGLTSGSLGGTFPSSYTVGGVANATKYVAISCIFTAGGAVSSIQDNTIAGFALYTASSTSSGVGNFCGIGVTSGSVNIGTITGNKIGTATSSIYVATTISAGIIAGIYVTSTNTATIQNNIIQNLDAMGTTASVTGGINGINTEGAGGNFVVSGNTIGNTTKPNLRMGNLTTGANLSNVGTTFGLATGTGIFHGIRNAATGTITIGSPGMPNIIRNATLNSSGSLALLRGIYSAGGTTNISYDTVSNLSSASSSVTFSNGGLGTVGILLYTCTAAIVSNNSINGLAVTNTGTGAYTLAGISYTAPATSMTISKNRIYGLSNASTSITTTAPGTATGIFLRDGFGVPHSIDNNMISLGNGQNTNTAFIGIWGQYGLGTTTTYKIYYNTINIEGTATGAQPSMCIQRGDFSATAVTVYTIDAKNNIFNNSRSGGTGKHYALANNYGVATSSAVGWGANASNYNALNGNPATIGYWSGDQSFASWKTASACDGMSVSGIPVAFVSTATGNLLLNMGLNPTPLESGGVVLAGYTTDIQGQTRPGPAGSVNGGGTVPDIGADEFDGVILDQFPPIISYTPLGHTPGTGDRILKATITDLSGVPTAPLSVGLPMLYWKTASTAYAGVQGVYNVVDNTYSFTFGGGVSLGDIVSYYVVAQDLVTPTPNVGGYPSGGSGYTPDPPAAGTPTTTPSTYIITPAPLSGDYTVGTTLFNKAAGKNIYFEKVTKKVTKEVFIEEPARETIQEFASGDNAKAPDGTVAAAESIVAFTVNGRYELKEVEEETWVPMENGHVYNGPLSVNRSGNLKSVPNAPVAGVYATITAAIADLNLRGVSGAVRFLLNDGSYTVATGETFPVIVNVANENLPTAANTVTIKPNEGVSSLIQCPTTTAATQIFQIRSSYVMIDGSNTVGGTTRDLTIENQYATAPQVIRIMSTGTIPITNVTVKNSIIINGITSSSALVVSDVAGTAGYFNDITIQNNSVQKAYIGIYFIASVAPTNGTGTLVTGNDLNTAGANSIRIIGVYVQGVNGATVSNNNIGNMSDANAELVRGIMFASGTYSGTISGNTISGIASTSATTTAAATGIYINPGTGVTGINITGNTISTLSCAGTLSNFAGILSFSPNTNITNNTVSGLTQTGAAGFWGIVQSGAVNSSCSGNTVSGLTTATTGAPNGINIQGVSSGVVISRNKVYNIKNTSSAGSSSVGLALSSSSTSANITVSNNVVYDIASYGVASMLFGNGYGIYIYSGGGYNIYYNSVNLATDQTLVSGVPACLNISSSITTPGTIDIRNNILSVPTTVGTDRYTVLCNALPNVFSFIDYNDYYTSGPNIGYMTTASVLDLPAWKVATGKDGSSISADPLFTAPANLLPQTGSPVIAAAVPMPTLVADDIDGTVRSLVSPTMGAYELAPPVTTKTLTVTAYLEGLYIGGSTMAQAFDENGPHFDPGIADKVIVELHDGGNYSNIVYSSGLVSLSTSGIVTVTDIPSLLSGSYFITIRHRNSIETTSAAAVSFAGAGPFAYDFSSGSSQAYLDNLNNWGGLGVFVIWGGDVNQDGSVDTGDMNDVENESTAFASGYLPADANGDGFVDTSDMNIVENNSTAFIMFVAP